MKGNENNKIMLTFDLEFWYDTPFLEKYLPEFREDYLVESVLPILELLEKYKARATFFTTGKVIKRYPEIVKKIYNQGHEIASHGYSHQLLSKITPQQFEAEMRQAVELTEKTIGKIPKGFRAPCLSLNKRTHWALPILAKLEFKYHSGRRSVPNSPLTEIPVGFAGGVYFRLLPLWLFKKMLKLTGIIYLHPHELYRDTPVIKRAPRFKKLLKYHGVKNSLEKFEKLLKNFAFDSVENILKFNHLIK